MKIILEHIKRCTLGILALLLFSNSTFAYAVDFHFCQDELKSISFFGQKASCSKMIDAKEGSCCVQKQTPLNEDSISSKSCCSNEQLENSTVLQKKVDTEPVIPSSFFALLPTEMSVVSDLTFDLNIDEFKIAHPPFLYRKNNQPQLQVFLI